MRKEVLPIRKTGIGLHSWNNQHGFCAHRIILRAADVTIAIDERNCLTGHRDAVYFPVNWVKYCSNPSCERVAGFDRK